jgi:hypothetical protein
LGGNKLKGNVPSFLTEMPALQDLNILGNYYTFDGMEDLVEHDFAKLQYGKQKAI